MLTAKTSELDLMEVWFDSDPEHARLRATFPINTWVGSRDSAVVYFKIESGDRLARHTDSAEEILDIVAGEAEAEVGRVEPPPPGTTRRFGRERERA